MVKNRRTIKWTVWAGFCEILCPFLCFSMSHMQHWFVNHPSGLKKQNTPWISAKRPVCVCVCAVRRHSWTAVECWLKSFSVNASLICCWRWGVRGWCAEYRKPSKLRCPLRWLRSRLHKSFPFTWCFIRGTSRLFVRGLLQGQCSERSPGDRLRTLMPLINKN